MVVRKSSSRAALLAEAVTNDREVIAYVTREVKWAEAIALWRDS
jgi:hypothetical protein